MSERAIERCIQMTCTRSQFIAGTQCLVSFRRPRWDLRSLMYTFYDPVHLGQRLMRKLHFFDLLCSENRCCLLFNCLCVFTSYANSSNYNLYSLRSRSRADLRFYKAGCPIHMKGAPEVERRRRRRGDLGSGLCPFPGKFCISYIKMVSFYAFPVIIIDTVLFKKGTLIKRAGVDPDTLYTPWIRPWRFSNHCCLLRNDYFRLPLDVTRTNLTKNLLAYILAEA